MSTQDNLSESPISGSMDEIKQEALSAAGSAVVKKVSENPGPPVADLPASPTDSMQPVTRSIYPDQQADHSEALSGGRLNHPDDIARYLSQKSFKDFLAEKDSLLVYCTLTIEGNEFLAKNSYVVELSQHTGDHDTFTIITPDDALDSFEGYVMEHSKKLLGKNVSINFHRSGEIRQTFSGIIANIRNKKNEGGGYGKLFITGYAPSILLENGKDCQSYENKTLEQIISETTAAYTHEAKVGVNNPNTQYAIPYTVQYKESDYQFIRRLANRYGEFFYYDGGQLVFGNKVQPIVRLEENKDLIDVEFELMIKAQGFNYMSYDSISAEVKEKDSDAVTAQSIENPFQSIAINASKAVFKKKPDMLFSATSHQRVDRDLEEMVKRQKGSRQHLLQVRGRSRDPELRIGSLAEISDINGKAMETYRIIGISHYHDGNEYSNEFIGIPDMFISPFFDEDAYPVCEEQAARVVDNNDPMGMGRVRVQFPWQAAKNQMTPWVRLIQPHSGAGKGFHFIPEIGEEVFVGFESQNAEKPFVMGTHYNGSETSSYHTSGNDKKVIHTRSGTKIILNDAEGSVFIEDPSGNTYLMDGAGNINVNAPKNMTFTAGENFSINVGKNMYTTVGNNKKLKVAKDNSIITTNYQEEISNNKTVKVTEKLEETTGSTKHLAKNGDILLHSNGVTTVYGSIDTKVNKG